jgi:hypothetical protein
MMEKQIGEIQKTKSVSTKVRLTKFKGRELLDIRDFFKAKSSVEFTPTRKGITLDVTKISEFLGLLEKAENVFLTSAKTAV